MTGFVCFASSEVEVQQEMEIEEDPAAAFLAREQDELADIAADTLGADTLGGLNPVAQTTVSVIIIIQNIISFYGHSHCLGSSTTDDRFSWRACFRGNCAD